MQQKAAKIEDVARHAGVSTATVSRALSNPDLVSENTRKRVLEAVRITGYRVNKAARNLRKRQAGAVLILVPNLGNPFFSQILAGLTEAFEKTDYALLIADTFERSETGKGVLDYFLDSRIDGMISLDGGLSQEDLHLFESNNLRDRIVFACEWVHGSTYPSVRTDNAQGAQLAMQHLYDLGHRKIAHITGPKGNVLTRMRRDAVLAYRKKMSLPVRDEWIIRGDFSLQSGFEAAQTIVNCNEPPTAVFCASDMVAFGLISGLAQQGVSVPKDISVIGFDDIEMAEYALPSLTSVHQDRRGLGHRAAAQLLSRMSAQASRLPEIETVGVTLSVRQSTAAPVLI